jgi:hypothetical protein
MRGDETLSLRLGIDDVRISDANGQVATVVAHANRAFRFFGAAPMSRLGHELPVGGRQVGSLALPLLHPFLRSRRLSGAKRAGNGRFSLLLGATHRADSLGAGSTRPRTDARSQTAFARPGRILSPRRILLVGIVPTM